jgi:hypothetical protein
MTQTSLSAATRTSPRAQRVYSARYLEGASSLARDAGSFQWHRPARRGGHSCLCAVAKPLPQRLAEATLSLPSKFLIANPRLTLRVSPIKISELQISNRKFSTIFQRTSHLVSLVTSHLSLATAFLIETPRLEITISPILSSLSNFLIETKLAFSVIPSAKTRIQCGPRENPR